MELQELVDRIQRWKERTSSDPAPIMEMADETEPVYEAAVSDTELEDVVMAEPIEENTGEPISGEDDVLDFEEMAVSDDDSGVVEVIKEEE